MKHTNIILLISILVSQSHFVLANLVEKPPHIIFIVADDLGWNDVGWHNDQIYTPNLDNLARNGVILNSSYVLPVCSPTRSAFMTGYYPIHTRLQHGIISHFLKRFLPERFSTIADKLKEVGYTTHMVGKWHLGCCNWKYTPTYRGFESFLGFYGGSQDYFTHTIGNSGIYDFRFNESVYHPPENKYSAEIFADRAVEIITSVDPETQPLFLYLPFQSVHCPFEVPNRYKRLYPNIPVRNRRIYCGMVSALDDAVGQVVNALESRGFMDNALLVFTTDNGGDIYKGASNYPLRGSKSTLWEGGTRGAAFVYSKNLFEKTRYVNNEIIHAVDWFPTFLSLAGGTPDPDMDGVNQWPTLSKGATSSRDEFLYNYDDVANYMALRKGKYKIIKGNHDVFPGKKMPKKWSLFDLERDPTEKENLASKLPDVVKELEKRIDYYRRTLVPSQLLPEDSSARMDFNQVLSPGWC